MENKKLDNNVAMTLIISEQIVAFTQEFQKQKNYLWAIKKDWKNKFGYDNDNDVYKGLMYYLSQIINKQATELNINNDPEFQDKLNKCQQWEPKTQSTNDALNYLYNLIISFYEVLDKKGINKFFELSTFLSTSWDERVIDIADVLGTWQNNVRNCNCFIKWDNCKCFNE